ncbi:MAG: hypothetical protein K2O89_00770 [Clostridia bacterium]|nr:hypothetical protein [Clostridia bacterium]
MENKLPYSQRNFRGKFKYSMLFFAILLIVTVALWVVTFRGNQLSNIAKYNKTVDATLISYDIIDIKPSNPTVIEIMYHYKYEDENGVVYEGDARTYINDYETADKAIENGQTVKIYIDGKGNSFLANTNISQTKIITILVFSIILTISTVVFFIIFLIPVKSKTEQ